MDTASQGGRHSAAFPLSSPSLQLQSRFTGHRGFSWALEGKGPSVRGPTGGVAPWAAWGRVGRLCAAAGMQRPLGSPGNGRQSKPGPPGPARGPAASKECLKDSDASDAELPIPSDTEEPPSQVLLLRELSPHNWGKGWGRPRSSAGAQGRQEASGSLGAMRSCGARCVWKVGQSKSAKPGRGRPAGGRRRPVGASASLYPHSNQ